MIPEMDSIHILIVLGRAVLPPEVQMVADLVVVNKFRNLYD